MAPRHDLEAELVERAQRDPEFRARLLAEPRGAIAEALAVELPADVTIRVVEEQPGEAVLVLPAAVSAGEVADTELADVAGGTGGSWCGHTHCAAACPITSPGGGCTSPLGGC